MGTAPTLVARVVHRGLTFLEGPRWHDGALWASDFYSHRVLRFADGTGDPETVSVVEQQPSGLGWTPAGDLLVVSMLDRRILRQQGGVITVHADASAVTSAPLNDLYVDPAGWALVGGFGHPWTDESAFGPSDVWHVAPDGTMTVAAEGLVFPNGIARRSDGVVLVAETFAGRVSAFSCDDAGRLTGRRTFVRWGAVDYLDVARANAELPVAPDGLAVDRDDRVWVADAIGHGARCLDADGREVAFVDTGHLSAYAVALDADERRLFLCCAPPNKTVDVTTGHHGELWVADLV